MVRASLEQFIFNRNPSQHVLLKRLKNHIDIKYVVPTEMVKSKKVKIETEQRTEQVIQSHRLRI